MRKRCHIGPLEEIELAIIAEHFSKSTLVQLAKMLPGVPRWKIRMEIKRLERANAQAKILAKGSNPKNLKHKGWGWFGSVLHPDQDEHNRRMREMAQRVFDEQLGREITRYPAGYATGAEPQRSVGVRL